MSHFSLVLMNRLNKTESAVFLYCFVLSIFDGFVFPGYFEDATAVVVSVWSWVKTSTRVSIKS